MIPTVKLFIQKEASFIQIIHASQHGTEKTHFVKVFSTNADNISTATFFASLASHICNYECHSFLNFVRAFIHCSKSVLAISENIKISIGFSRKKWSLTICGIMCVHFEFAPPDWVIRIPRNAGIKPF